MKHTKLKKGFTLIEILVVIGLIAILATIVLIAINPARQFAQARNTQRVSNVNAILNAIGQNMADNKGIFTCSGTARALPVNTSATSTSQDMAAAKNDISACFVPTYISALPVDPTAPATSPYACTPATGSSYDSCYAVSQDANGRVIVSAPFAELGQYIAVTR